MRPTVHAVATWGSALPSATQSCLWTPRAPSKRVALPGRFEARLGFMCSKLTETAAVEQLAQQRSRLVSGQTDFATLAREISQDASAAQGGELGWAAPGMFVPEFEEAMNRLAPNEISAPLVSRFGVHLIQVLERKDVELSPKAQRDQLTQMVREQKMEEAYKRWIEEVRSSAYVEYRDAPQ